MIDSSFGSSQKGEDHLKQNKNKLNHNSLNKDLLSGNNLNKNSHFADNLSAGYSPYQSNTAQLKEAGSTGQPNSSTTAKNKTGLPDSLKTGIEDLSGYSMNDVKVHYNSSKPAQLSAHAYAQGTDIHVAPGQEQHLPHEAWHVVQQKQGRVQPTLQMKGNVNINDDSGLEKEADVMGAKAMHQNTGSMAVQKKAENSSSTLSAQNKSTSGSPIQMAVNIENLDARYQSWLQLNDTDTFVIYVNSKTGGEYDSLNDFLEAGNTTKELVQKLMRNFVGKSAMETTKQKIAEFRAELPERHEKKFERSVDFTNKDKLRKVGEHAVKNTFDRELANLPNGTRLYHCTKAAQAIMDSEMKGGSGIRDGGNKFQLDPSLIGRTSFTTDVNRTMLGHDQLVMVLQQGDIERYGIFHFSRDEYVATRPIPGGRFSIT